MINDVDIDTSQIDSDYRLIQTNKISKITPLI